jgi:hypothetical protein
LIGGDFNLIRYAKERNSNTGVHRHTGLFNSLIHMYELTELTMTGGLFTWSNNQEFLILEKLDRILTTKDWEDLFCLALIKKMPREISDHNPLLLLTGTKTPSKTIQFRFELSWLKNPDFLNQVKKYGTNHAEPKPPLLKSNRSLSFSNNILRGGDSTFRMSSGNIEKSCRKN